MTCEIKITVTPKGKKYDIETVFPLDVRVGELIDVLDSARQSLAKAGLKFMERHHQLTEPENRNQRTRRSKCVL